MTWKESSQNTPSITLVNTNFTNIDETANNFYGYNDSSGGTDKFVTPNNCSANPCTVSPFTGPCYPANDTSPNFGVLCDYDSFLTCPSGSYTQSVKGESTSQLPPPYSSCGIAKPIWDCQSQYPHTIGVFQRSHDCKMSSQVTLTGDLSITGRRIRTQQ